MSIVKDIPTSLPFHLARAYGVAPRQFAPARAAQCGAAPEAPVESNGANRERIARLVAAIMPGRVDFSGADPAVGPGLPMYAHPAEKHAAATAVFVGRNLDVNG